MPRHESAPGHDHSFGLQAVAIWLWQPGCGRRCLYYLQGPRLDSHPRFPKRRWPVRRRRAIAVRSGDGDAHPARRRQRRVSESVTDLLPGHRPALTTASIQIQPESRRAVAVASSWHCVPDSGGRRALRCAPACSAHVRAKPTQRPVSARHGRVGPRDRPTHRHVPVAQVASRQSRRSSGHMARNARPGLSRRRTD